MSSNFCDMSIEILRKTRDGEDLAPEHLWLLQTAVNGWLAEAGEVAFMDLYANVTSESGYVRAWLHGQEHLTKYHEGFVYWRGKQVEHYSFREDRDGERAAALELAKRCRYLDRIGLEANTKTAVWEWHEKHEQAMLANPEEVPPCPAS